MINLNINKKIFNDVYFPLLLDYSHRYEVYYGGAGSGKSVFVFLKIVVKSLRSRRRVLVVRKVAKTNENSTFKNVCDTLIQFNIYNLCSINKTTMKITLPNGSEFIFIGLDDVEKVKSIAGITDIICEEATELTVDDVSQLDLRLRPREKNPQMFYMFNPTSRANWVFKRWFADDAEIDTLTTIITKTTYKDNKFLTKEYVEALESQIRTNPTYYKIYALGEFCSLDKLVYNNWEVADFDYKAVKGLLLCGLDFGFSADTTAFICSLLDEANRKIYIFKSWGDTGKTNDEIASIISSLGFAKSTIIADSAEPKSVEELRRAGLIRIKPSVKGADSIVHGIQRLQQYLIIVHSSLSDVITEFENYSWKKDKTTNEYINTPIDLFNHYLDALRYSMQCADVSKLKVMDKRLLGL